MPLNITIFVIQRSAPDFEWSNAHPRANLAELTRVIRSPDKNVMSDFDNIIDVFEGHDPAALGLAGSRGHRREEMLEHFDKPLS